MADGEDEVVRPRHRHRAVAGQRAVEAPCPFAVRAMAARTVVVVDLRAQRAQRVVGARCCNTRRHGEVDLGQRLQVLGHGLQVDRAQMLRAREDDLGHRPHHLAARRAAGLGGQRSGLEKERAPDR